MRERSYEILRMILFVGSFEFIANDLVICKTSGKIVSEDNMTLHSEIFEQPERLAALLENQKQTVLEIAKAINLRGAKEPDIDPASL